MANKVVTIIVDDHSLVYGNLMNFMHANQEELVSSSIKDEDDPLFPDHPVSRPWLRENWKVSTLDSHVLDNFGLTPKQLRDKALAGELPHTMKHDDPTKLVLVVIENADELRQAMLERHPELAVSYANATKTAR